MTARLDSPERHHNLNKILTDLFEWADYKTKILVYHLYGKGYTCEDVGKLWGVTKQAISLQYPKNKKGGEILNRDS